MGEGEGEGEGEGNSANTPQSLPSAVYYNGVALHADGGDRTNTVQSLFHAKFYTHLTVQTKREV